jgi:adenine-specific DNA methylase
VLKDWKRDVTALTEMIGAEQEFPEFKEYGEDIADGIQVCKCPTCGHEHAAPK